MGCGASLQESTDVLHSRSLKIKALLAIEVGTEWRQSWLEFSDAMEQAQMAASHWATV